MTEIRLSIQEIRLSFMFKNIEPIPEDILLEWLVEKNFEIITEIPKKIGTITFGIERVNIARRGDCQVLYDPHVGSLGIAGNRPAEVLKEFEVIESMLKEKGFDLSTDIKSIELVFHGRAFVRDRFKPLEKICKFIGIDKFSKFNEVMGEEVAPFDIRFYPKREMKTSENLRHISRWFDVHIHPLVENPNYCAIHVVFRDTNITNIKAFTETIRDKILQILTIIIEGGK